MKKSSRVIVHVIEATAYGTLTMAKELANYQSAMGEDVTVVYSKRKETPCLHSLFNPDVELVNVQMSLMPSVATVQGIFAVRKIVRDKGAGAVFLHSSIAGAFGRISLSGLNVPVYYIPHCISFMRTDLGVFKKKLFVYLEYMTSRIKKSLYLTCSQSEFDEVRRNLPSVPCSLINNGVDTRYWSVHNREVRRNIVVNVAMLRAQKNPARFSRICKLARRSGVDAEFLWIGGGENDLFKNQLVDAGVKYLGAKNSDEIREILCESTWFLSTSDWEGLPVAPLEAMANGCVCILTNCQGNKDIVSHQLTGYIYSKEEQVVEILKHNLSDPKCAKVVANRGQKFCFNNHNMQTYLNEMYCILD